MARTAVRERHELTTVERDLCRVARYWGRRKQSFLPALARDFLTSVDPAVLYKEKCARNEEQLVNMCMTEWFLFERPYEDGKTPLQLFLEQTATDDDDPAMLRLQQVAETQFFARFSILEKDPESGFAVLEDVGTGRRYRVLDPQLCSVDRWQEGVIAERIACVDDVWQVAGQVHLYDVAPASATAGDAPGDIHPEDVDDAARLEAMGFYLRLVRDVLGSAGPYALSARVVLG